MSIFYQYSINLSIIIIDFAIFLNNYIDIKSYLIYLEDTDLNNYRDYLTAWIKLRIFQTINDTGYFNLH